MIPINELLTGHAAQVLANLPAGCIDLIITSPPYWTAVKYDGGGSPWSSYSDYLEDMLTVWPQCARVLRPNGKLCVNAMAMPIPQDVIPQDTRKILNIPADVYYTIVNGTDLRFYDEYVWRKQTSKAMFGSRHRPGNLLACNATERITIFVKPGKTPKFTPEVQAANWIPDGERLDLIQQIWNMYPANVKRDGDHPAPFPEKLPARLIRMFTYGAVGDFPGEIVLDPFCGTGATCVVAKRMGRRFIGMDINEHFVSLAQKRVRAAVVGHWPVLFVGPAPKYMTTEELTNYRPEAKVRLTGDKAKRKHHRKTCGRRLQDVSSTEGPTP